MMRARINVDITIENALSGELHDANIARAIERAIRENDDNDERDMSVHARIVSTHDEYDCVVYMRVEHVRTLDDATNEINAHYAPANHIHVVDINDVEMTMRNA